MELLHIELHYNTQITEDNYELFNADAIICASGSTPRKMAIEGNLPVYSADEVLLAKKNVNDNVVLIGGGLVGCETALWLAQQGKTVSVVEIADEILGGHNALPHMNYTMLVDLLKFHNINVYTSSKVLKTTDTDVLVETPEGEIKIPATDVITSIGYVSNDTIFNQLKDLDMPVYNIGDSSKVHNIMYSIWNAYELARTI